MSAFLPSGHDHAHSLSHGTASWLNRIRAQFTALRYFALDGTGPPQPQGTGQPVHHLANNHADDERLRQIVTGQTLPDAALIAKPWLVVAQCGLVTGDVG
jgi:hypothetical protein